MGHLKITPLVFKILAEEDGTSLVFDGPVPPFTIAWIGGKVELKEIPGDFLTVEEFKKREIKQ